MDRRKQPLPELPPIHTGVSSADENEDPNLTMVMNLLVDINTKLATKWAVPSHQGAVSRWSDDREGSPGGAQTTEPISAPCQPWHQQRHHQNNKCHRNSVDDWPWVSWPPDLPWHTIWVLGQSHRAPEWKTGPKFCTPHMTTQDVKRRWPPLQPRAGAWSRARSVLLTPLFSRKSPGHTRWCTPRAGQPVVYEDMSISLWVDTLQWWQGGEVRSSHTWSSIFKH